MPRVQSGHERGAGRRADRRAAERLRVARALARHAVEARGLNELLPIGADVTLREIVAEDENDIGLRGLSGGGGVEERAGT